MLAIIFLCIMKSYLFAMFMCNFTTTSLSIAEILLFIKRWSKIIAVANIAALTHACCSLTPANNDVNALCVSVYRNFCINKKW